MSLAVSEEYGKLAHELTNEARIAEKQAQSVLDWSDILHNLAYNRLESVARGEIEFGRSNFGVLLAEIRSEFEPDFQVFSMSEQITKIVDVRKSSEDYVQEWRDNWRLDHLQDAMGSFTNSATSVYFDSDRQEVLFTQIFIDLSAN